MNHARLHLSTRHFTMLMVLLLTIAALCATAQPVTAQTLRIGMTAEQDIFSQKKRFTPLFEYLGKQTGMSFELRILPRHLMVSELFARQELDAAFFGSLIAAIAIETVDMQPLARPHYTDGLASDYGIVFTRRNAGILSADDMRNKRLVLVDPASTTGYLMPLRYFREIGIEDYRTWFAHYYFAGTYEETMLEVIKGYADIGVTRNSIYYRAAGRNPQVLDQLEILASSPHVPTTTFGVRNDLAADITTRLQGELLKMHQTASGRMVLENLGFERFVPTTQEDFDQLKVFAKELGIDVSRGYKADE